MKKFVGIVLLSLSFLSCRHEIPEPIERYGGSKYVITNINLTVREHWKIQLKNKDTIFNIYVLRFDGKGLKIGDTIR